MRTLLPNSGWRHRSFSFTILRSFGVFALFALLRRYPVGGVCSRATSETHQNMHKPNNVPSMNLDCSSLEETRRPNRTIFDGRLFGRADSVLELSDAYRRRLEPNQELELVLITGNAGVGKTALASTLKGRVSIDHGFFLHGKLDELLTSTTLSTVNTYGPFVEALTEYCNHVMEAEEEFIVSVRKVLLMNMSPSELLVIQETVPNVSKMLGCTPEKYPRQQSRRIALRGADAEERFIHIVCKFVEIISSQGYPIVLLLDDVQWSNQSSLALIRAVAAIEKTNAGCRLFVICTCREDNRALFDSTSQSLQSGDYQVKHIALSALSLSAVHQLITDVLGDASTDAGKATRTEVLARNIFSPTQGNPFHILQILYEVQHEKLLRTCQDQVKWDPIENESVISLIQKRLNRLPDKAKVVVKVAACLGSAFSEESLKAGVLFSLSDAMSAIRCCQQEGILAIGKDPSKIRFTHDEFRRAAYMMIPTTERNAFHLDVGRRLWHLLPKERCDEHLLIIADQMSHAIRLIQDGDERHKVSRLFLRAGQKAAQTSSFALAAQYLRYGIGLLKSKHWEKQYKLSLSLYNKAAEIEYYCGNLARVDVLVDKILKSAKSFEDTLVARFTRIYCLGSRNDMARALDEGFQVLKRLGERLPRHFVSARLAWEKSQCYWRLRGKSHQEILDLPLLADTKKVTALRLMNILHSFALLSSDKCAPMIASRVVRMTLQHGLHEVSCVGFANLGLMYAFQGNVDRSYCCSLLALSIFEKYQGSEWEGRLSFSTYAFAFPLKRPLRESVPHLLDGHSAGLVSGDISFSMLCAYMYCRMRFYAGDPILQVLNEAKKYRCLASKYCQHFCLSHFDTLIQFCLNLMGEAEDPLVLTGDGINEVEALRLWEETSMISYFGVLVAKHFMAVYMNDLTLAGHLAATMRLKRVEKKLLPFVMHNHMFLQGVASATLSRTSCEHKEQANRLLKELRESAQHCPENYLHKVYLIEAEIANSSGCHDDALAKYDRSIELAERQGFLQEHALACEKAGCAMRDQGDTGAAKEYFQQARSLYRQWGAQVKVDQLAIDLALLGGTE